MIKKRYYIIVALLLALPAAVLAINDVSILQTTYFDLNTADTAAATTITAQAGDTVTNISVATNYLDITLDNASTITFNTTVAGQYLAIAKVSGSDAYTSAPSCITNTVTLTGTGAQAVIRVTVGTAAPGCASAAPPITGGFPILGPGEGYGPGGTCTGVSLAVSVKINSGALVTGSRGVILSLDYANATKVAVSEDPAFTGKSFQAISASIPFTLSDGAGLKTVYVRFNNDCTTLDRAVAITYTPGAAVQTARELFPRVLQLGSSGSDVRVLQQILAADPAVYPQGLVTGFFGPLTLQAVKNFQVKYGLAGPDDDSYGKVDTATAQKLFEIYTLGKEVEVFPGDLVKLACPADSAVNDPCRAVYYIGDDLLRHVFPDQKTFFSRYSDFSAVKIVSATQLAAYKIGTNVTHLPGDLVKVMTNPDVYVVTEGGILRKITSEALARELFGDNWASLIEDIPDAFWVNYTVGEDMGSAAQ